MLKIAVCDDDPVHRGYTASLVRQELAESPPLISSFGSGEALLASVGGDKAPPDIAILDIEMGQLDGISLAAQLKAIAPQCQIIFLTSYLDYATDVYAVEHCYFIIKRQLDRRLGPALRRAAAALDTAGESSPCVMVAGKRSAVSIPLDSIIFMERSGRSTRISTLSGDVCTAQRPQELLQGLPGEPLIRCHQSFWLNTSKITGLKNNEFTLFDGRVFPISRTYRQHARARFFDLMCADAVISGAMRT